MGKTVLVVDDSADIRALLEVALSDKYEVSTVEGGQQALDFLSSRPDRYPALVVLDIMMPGVDGYGVLDGLERIKYKGKVVVFSAVGEQDRARLAGYDLVKEIIKKPSELAVILAKIDGLIGESGDQEFSL